MNGNKVHMKTAEAYIDFARCCWACNAITREEFYQWCLYVVDHLKAEYLPKDFFKLMKSASVDEHAFTGLKRRLSTVEADSETFDDALLELSALIGIGIERYGLHVDTPFAEQYALSALQQCPHVKQRFLSTFPFIEYAQRPCLSAAD